MSDVESRIARVEEKVQTLFKNDSKQDSMINAVHEMATNMGKMTVSMENMQKEMSNIKKEMNRTSIDVDGLKNKPAQHWNQLVSTGIAAVVGGLIGYAFFKLGLK